MTSDQERSTPLTPTHPLDPLTRAELEGAVDILRSEAHIGQRARFVEISLQEPTKSWVAEFQPAAPFERRAFAIVLDPTTGRTYEGIILLGEGTLESWRHVADVQPAVTPEEYAECEQVVRADPGFRERLAARGIDPEHLVVEAWGIGSFAGDEVSGRRLVWTPCWVRTFPEANPYAKPVEGLYAIVDLNRMEIVSIEDHGAVSLPPEPGDYLPGTIELRSDLRPFEVVQAEGPSFSVEGWKVTWQKWHVRIGFTPREGLVLYDLAYEEALRRRPILHRASYVELFVPYGDPSPGSYRKNAFDIGEYGLGALTNSLERDCDCLGEIHYFDAHLCNDRGEVYAIKNAICLHEEDAGVLWKHYDAATQRADVRRSRRLVISSIVTAGNYEYAFYWYLYQDGTIEAETKLTGILLTGALPPETTSQYGTLVAPQLVAANHQHFFCTRLDMTVDGPLNRVFEVHTEAEPRGDGNPHGNAFFARETLLRREEDAQMDVDPARGRFWRITNDLSRNRSGGPAGYRLIPGGNIRPFADNTSSVLRRAGFLRHHLWVTPCEGRERFPVGDYPNQHPGGDGLPRWTKQNRSIEDADVVLWYTFGSHHIPRMEDWPVMPVERAGFMLKPDGFFERNPSLDVAPLDHGHGHTPSAPD